MTTVISENFYKLNSSYEVLEQSTSFFTAWNWRYDYNVIGENLYNNEATTYIIQYQDGAYLISVSQSIAATKQKILRYMFKGDDYYTESGTYGTFVLGTKYTNSNVTFNLSTYSLTGYTSLQWNTSPNLDGTNYNLSALYTTNKSVNFYLKKTALSYKVYYAANNGNSTPPQATVNYGATYTLPVAISRTGYTFAGWKTGSEPNKDAGSSFTWNYLADTTFTAQWTANTYTIAYYDGLTQYTGATALSPISITYNSIYNSPTPTKTGYTFSGWFRDGTFTNEVIASGSTWTYTTTQTFYAKFTGISYTLTYYLNSGTLPNSPASIIVKYGDAYNIPEPTRTNYTFNGWYTDSHLQNRINSSGTWQLTSVNALYAKYTINGYDLTYNTNSIGGAGKTYNTVIVGTTPTIPIPKAFGYTFNGWYDAQSGGTKIINSDGSGGYTMPAVATTLYAQWTDNSDVRFSYLENTYGNIIAGNNRISISEYQSSISKPTSSKTALKADFKGKGPEL